jgi:2-polyprenylphenol hydroxylase and related flavodoxin oxidoreductases
MTTKIDVENPYLPVPLKLEEVTEEVSGPRAIKRFKVKKLFDYKPGQCAMLSVFGHGEVMLAISSSPTRNYLEFGVLKMGIVTNALHDLKQGDCIGVRGPFGNGFPLKEWKGKNNPVHRGRDWNNPSEVGDLLYAGSSGRLRKT